MKLKNTVTNTQAANTFKTLLTRCIEVHGNKYNYDKVVFEKMAAKVTITCPIHGDFTQTMTKHINNRSGCRKCNQVSPTGIAMPFKEFIEKAAEVHSGKYTYNFSTYTKCSSKLEIYCPAHGVFEQSGDNHLRGMQCPKCAKEVQKSKLSLSREQAIAKIKANSPTSWDFSKFKYTSAHKKCIVICPQHGEHLVTVNNLFNGNGCPKCAGNGFDFSKPAILYYLRIDNGQAYKIGITNRTVEERFSLEELSRIEVLKILRFSSGEACYKVEQALLKMFQTARRIGPPILKSGNTELFRRDILPQLSKGFE